MNSQEIEVLAEASNILIIRNPHRKFPGMVIQGDTLHRWFVTIKTLCKSDKESVDEDFGELAYELLGEIEMYLNIYESTLKEHHMQLPYFNQQD